MLRADVSRHARRVWPVCCMHTRTGGSSREGQWFLGRRRGDRRAWDVALVERPDRGAGGLQCRAVRGGAVLRRARAADGRAVGPDDRDGRSSRQWWWCVVVGGWRRRRFGRWRQRREGGPGDRGRRCGCRAGGGAFVVGATSLEDRHRNRGDQQHRQNRGHDDTGPQQRSLVRRPSGAPRSRSAGCRRRHPSRRPRVGGSSALREVGAGVRTDPSDPSTAPCAAPGQGAESSGRSAPMAGGDRGEMLADDDRGVRMRKRR